MNQLSLSWPSSLQTPDQQNDAIQQALNQIQQTVNANATPPLTVLHLASFSDSTSYTPGASFGVVNNYSWNVSSSGGVFLIDAIINGEYYFGAGGTVALFIDGKAVQYCRAMGGSNSGASQWTEGTAVLSWRAVLSTGVHNIQIQALGTNFVINGTSRGSNVGCTVSIIEFPQGVLVKQGN